MRKITNQHYNEFFWIPKNIEKLNNTKKQTTATIKKKITQVGLKIWEEHETKNPLTLPPTNNKSNNFFLVKTVLFQRRKQKRKKITQVLSAEKLKIRKTQNNNKQIVNANLKNINKMKILQ